MLPFSFSPNDKDGPSVNQAIILAFTWNQATYSNNITVDIFLIIYYNFRKNPSCPWRTRAHHGRIEGTRGASGAPGRSDQRNPGCGKESGRTQEAGNYHQRGVPALHNLHG